MSEETTIKPSEKPPAHPFEVRISIGANTWPYVAEVLEELAREARSRAADSFQMVSGGWSGGFSVTSASRNITPEDFRDELRQWRDKLA